MLQISLLRPLYVSSHGLKANIDSGPIELWTRTLTLPLPHARLISSPHQYKVCVVDRVICAQCSIGPNHAWLVEVLVRSWLKRRSVREKAGVENRLTVVFPFFTYGIYIYI